MSMEQRPGKEQALEAHIRPVHCRRLGRRLATSQHEDCLYCFGTEDEIRTRDHELFCDFRPGVDPVNFGFPQTHGRYWRA